MIAFQPSGNAFKQSNTIQFGPNLQTLLIRERIVFSLDRVCRTLMRILCFTCTVHCTIQYTVPLSSPCPYCTTVTCMIHGMDGTLRASASVAAAGQLTVTVKLWLNIVTS